MPLNAQSFIAPRGNLTPSMFEGDLATRLDGYLGEAQDRVAELPDPAQSDAMITAYVYWKAYSALYASLLAAPSSTTLADQGSVSWSAAQMAEIGRLAQSYRVEFEDLFVRVTPPPSIQPSAATRTKVIW